MAQKNLKRMALVMRPFVLQDAGGESDPRTDATISRDESLFLQIEGNPSYAWLVSRYGPLIRALNRAHWSLPYYEGSDYLIERDYENDFGRRKDRTSLMEKMVRLLTWGELEDAIYRVDQDPNIFFSPAPPPPLPPREVYSVVRPTPLLSTPRGNYYHQVIDGKEEYIWVPLNGGNIEKVVPYSLWFERGGAEEIWRTLPDTEGENVDTFVVQNTRPGVVFHDLDHFARLNTQIKALLEKIAPSMQNIYEGVMESFDEHLDDATISIRMPSSFLTDTQRTNFRNLLYFVDGYNQMFHKCVQLPGKVDRLVDGKVFEIQTAGLYLTEDTLNRTKFPEKAERTKLLKPRDFNKAELTRVYNAFDAGVSDPSIDKGAVKTLIDTISQRMDQYYAAKKQLNDQTDTVNEIKAIPPAIRSLYANKNHLKTQQYLDAIAEQQSKVTRLGEDIVQMQKSVNRYMKKLSLDLFNTMDQTIKGTASVVLLQVPNVQPDLDSMQLFINLSKRKAELPKPGVAIPGAPDDWSKALEWDRTEYDALEAKLKGGDLRVVHDLSDDITDLQQLVSELGKKQSSLKSDLENMARFSTLAQSKSQDAIMALEVLEPSPQQLFAADRFSKIENDKKLIEAARLKLEQTYDQALIDFQKFLDEQERKRLEEEERLRKEAERKRRDEEERKRLAREEAERKRQEILLAQKTMQEEHDKIDPIFWNFVGASANSKSEREKVATLSVAALSNLQGYIESRKNLSAEIDSLSQILTRNNVFYHTSTIPYAIVYASTIEGRMHEKRVVYLGKSEDDKNLLASLLAAWNAYAQYLISIDTVLQNDTLVTFNAKLMEAQKLISMEQPQQILIEAEGETVQLKAEIDQVKIEWQPEGRLLSRAFTSWKDNSCWSDTVVNVLFSIPESEVANKIWNTQELKAPQIILKYAKDQVLSLEDRGCSVDTIQAMHTSFLKDIANNQRVTEEKYDTCSFVKQWVKNMKCVSLMTITTDPYGKASPILMFKAIREVYSLQNEISILDDPVLDVDANGKTPLDIKPKNDEVYIVVDLMDRLLDKEEQSMMKGDPTFKTTKRDYLVEASLSFGYTLSGVIEYDRSRDHYVSYVYDFLEKTWTFIDNIDQETNKFGATLDQGILSSMSPDKWVSKLVYTSQKQIDELIRKKEAATQLSPTTQSVFAEVIAALEAGNANIGPLIEQITRVEDQYKVIFAAHRDGLIELPVYAGFLADLLDQDDPNLDEIAPLMGVTVQGVLPKIRYYVEDTQ